MTLMRAMTLLSCAAYAPLRTHRLHGLRAKKADPADHEDFDDSYALNDIRTNELRLPTMADLMRRTDEELRERQKDTSKREALRQKAGESIVDGSRAVLEQLEDLESHNHTISNEFTVAIVLGKALKNSRLSVEHAARCSTLVRQMKDGTLNPSMLMFTASAASMAPGAVRDDATTACTYFLHLCESEGVDVDAGAIHVTHTPVTTRDGMGKVLEEAIVPRLPSKSSLHCAFFASDYQLTRLERIGSVTPRLSLFAPLAARRDAYLKNLTAAPTTWSLVKVSYPPGLLTSGEDGVAAAFLAQLYMCVISVRAFDLCLPGGVASCSRRRRRERTRVDGVEVELLSQTPHRASEAPPSSPDTAAGYSIAWCRSCTTSTRSCSTKRSCAGSFTTICSWGPAWNSTSHFSAMTH